MRGRQVARTSIEFCREQRIQTTRQPEFEILESAPELRPQEMQMAASLIDSLSTDFDPTRFDDGYRDAVAEMIERKRSTGDTRPAPVAAAADRAGDSMSDLLTALEASVAAARGRSAGSGTGGDARPGAGTKVPAQRSESLQAGAVPAQRTPSGDGGTTEPAAPKPKPRAEPAARKPAARTPAAKSGSEAKPTRRSRKPA